MRDTVSPVSPLWDQRKAIQSAGQPVLTEKMRDAAAKAYGAAIAAARYYLPLPYEQPYIEPLIRHLGRVVRSSDDNFVNWYMAEALAGAVAQHQPGSPVRQPLRQFLAVVSNLYRSFVAADSRVSAGMPLVKGPLLPPLVIFHPHLTGGGRFLGPSLLASPEVHRLFGSEVPVAILPATFYRTPLVWASLAHEVCGHGVLRADPDLLPDLITGIRTLFGVGPVSPGQSEVTIDQALGLLWSYWGEETASDVCGLLNIGPAFALNLAAYLGALSMGGSVGGRPLLPANATSTGDSPDLDVHPPALLRLFVAKGVIENLVAFPRDQAQPYLGALDAIIQDSVQQIWESADAQRMITIRGRVEVNRERWVKITQQIPLAAMSESARRVGAFIAMTRIPALGNRSVQDLETWDSTDEEAALAICAALRVEPAVRKTGPDGSVQEVPIRKALADAKVALARIEKIIELLRTSQFSALTNDELIALGLEALTPKEDKKALIDALEANDLAPLVGAGMTDILLLNRIESMGDDAQLLAGATLAVLNHSEIGWFDWINRQLAFALSRSFENDGLLGLAHLERSPFISQPPVEADDDKLQLGARIGAAASPEPSAARPAVATDGRKPKSPRNGQSSSPTSRTRRRGSKG